MKKVIWIVIIFSILLIGCERRVVMSGRAMEPTYKSKDIVTVDFSYYISNTPKRGDIVLVKDDKGEMVFKRIVGLPSEKIKFKDGKVYINDSELKEDYLPSKTNTDYFGKKEWQVPDKCVFIMGDNRDISRDSRIYGPILIENIFGKVK